MTREEKDRIEKMKQEVILKLIEVDAIRDILGRVASIGLAGAFDVERQKKRIGDEFDKVLNKFLDDPAKFTSDETRDLISFLIMKEMSEPVE
jgi:GMP synthase PP-ATPase subunit